MSYLLQIFSCTMLVFITQNPCLASYTLQSFTLTSVPDLELTITCETSAVRQLITVAPCNRRVNPINSKRGP